MARRGAVAGVVLAAGASRRAGFCKALATIDDEAIVVRIARTLSEAGCAPLVVVVGPPHEACVADALRAHPELPTTIARNPDPARGMLSSLKVGLDATREAKLGVAVVALLDQPRVASATVQALVHGWRASDASFLRPLHDGKHGHPYLVDRALFEALREAPDDQGARPVLRAAAQTLDVPVDDAHILDDLDTPEDFAALGALRPS